MGAYPGHSRAATYTCALHRIKKFLKTGGVLISELVTALHIRTYMCPQKWESALCNFMLMHGWAVHIT